MANEVSKSKLVKIAENIADISDPELKSSAGSDQKPKGSKRKPTGAARAVISVARKVAAAGEVAARLADLSEPGNSTRGKNRADKRKTKSAKKKESPSPQLLKMLSGLLGQHEPVVIGLPGKEPLALIVPWSEIKSVVRKKVRRSILQSETTAPAQLEKTDPKKKVRPKEGQRRNR